MKAVSIDIPARRSGVGGIALIILLIAGCGGDGYGSGGTYGGAATLSGLAITPGSETVIDGTSAKLTAIASYSDGSKADISNSVTWSSSVPGVASVGNTGVVTGNAVGVSTISASVNNGMYSAASASDTVTVTTASLTGITIAPATASLAMGPRSHSRPRAAFRTGAAAISRVRLRGRPAIRQWRPSMPAALQPLLAWAPARSQLRWAASPILSR